MSTLYIIATPIGNLDDITLRALNVLKNVSVVLAEDTRVTRRLLGHYQIVTHTMTWHQHSTSADWERIKSVLMRDQDCAFVTDAGTPGLSDPGGKLVEYVTKELPAVRIVPIPGASALTTAISVAGIPLDSFMFLGFLPHKKGRQTNLKKIAQSDMPVIVYESVHRIGKLLTELIPMKKNVIVCRELTKVYETIYRGRPEDVLKELKPGETKGEFVVIIHN